MLHDLNAEKLIHATFRGVGEVRARSLTSPEPFFVFSYTAFASSIHCVKLLPSSSEAESKPLSSELSTNSLVVAAVSGAC